MSAERTDDKREPNRQLVGPRDEPPAERRWQRLATASGVALLLRTMAALRTEHAREQERGEKTQTHAVFVQSGDSKDHRENQSCCLTQAGAVDMSAQHQDATRQPDARSVLDGCIDTRIGTSDPALEVHRLMRPDEDRLADAGATFDETAPVIALAREGQPLLGRRSVLRRLASNAVGDVRADVGAVEDVGHRASVFDAEDVEIQVVIAGKNECGRIHDA